MVETMDRFTKAYLKIINEQIDTSELKDGSDSSAKPTYKISFYYQDWPENEEEMDEEEYEEYHNAPVESKPFDKAFKKYGGKTDGIPHDQGEVTGENAGDYNYIYEFDAITAQDLYNMFNNESDIMLVPFLESMDVINDSKSPEEMVDALKNADKDDYDALIYFEEN